MKTKKGFKEIEKNTFFDSNRIQIIIRDKKPHKENGSHQREINNILDINFKIIDSKMKQEQEE